MRKFLIPLLMAGVMMPAAVMAQDRDHQRERGDEQRAERSEHRADRAESRASEEGPQRQERVERPQREQIVARSAQPSQEAPQQNRFERRERQIERIQQAEPVQQVREAPTQEVRINQQRGVLGAIRETARQQQTLEARPATRDGHPDGYRDSRGGSHSGYHRDLRQGHGDLHSSDPSRREHRGWHRDAERQHDRRHAAWTTDWRRDSRYNWYDYRNRYGSLYDLGRYHDPYGWGYRRFSIGFNIGSGYYGSNYWLDDPWMYRLPPAYGPYRWVRYYDDALLVNIYSGQVVDVINNFFW